MPNLTLHLDDDGGIDRSGLEKPSFPDYEINPLAGIAKPAPNQPTIICRRQS